MKAPPEIPERLRALIGQGTDAIETPALVVDLDAANRNQQRMTEFAAKHRLRLRPHAKMHKSAEFGRLQLQAGAAGLCVQTVGEAEALAAAGVVKPLLQLGLPDEFIEHGDPARLLSLQGLDAAGIEASVRQRFGELASAASPALKIVA